MFQPINTRRLISRYKPITVEAGLIHNCSGGINATDDGIVTIMCCVCQQRRISTTPPFLPGCRVKMGMVELRRQSSRWQKTWNSRCCHNWTDYLSGIGKKGQREGLLLNSTKWWIADSANSYISCMEYSLATWSREQERTNKLYIKRKVFECIFVSCDFYKCPPHGKY